VLDAVEPARAQPLGCADRRQIRHLIGDRPEDQIDGHLRQVGADTVVRTGAAEADVRIRIPQDVEPERIVEHLLVEVRGTVGHHHPLTLLDGHPRQFDILDGRALERRDRRGPPDDLVGGRVGAFAFVELPLLRVLGERDHAVGDGVAGGLVAGNRQQHHEETELVIGELVPVDVGFDQLGHDVLAGLFGADRRELHRVHDQFHCRVAAVVVGELRIIIGDHLIGPVEDLLPVFQRDPDQACDGLQG
jgi:hypothetical protein